MTSAVLCEFCRSELSGKTTIIGAFSGDVVVNEFPSNFPISAYFEIMDVPEGEHGVGFQFRIADATFEIAAGITVSGRYGAFPLPTTEVQISEPGLIEVKFRLDDEDWQTLISKKVVAAN